MEQALLGVARVPRTRLTPLQREELGRRQAMAAPRDRHLAARLADAHATSASWMRTLRRRQERGIVKRRPGRPRLPDAERARVRGLVLEELDRQGYGAGYRDVLEAIRRREEAHELEGRASEMLVQQETARAKREARAKAREAIEARRVGHDVLAREAVWSEDTTQVGRTPEARPVDAEVIVDRGSLATVGASPGGPPTAEAVLQGLRRAALERGGWPLVLQVDNGTAYRSWIVRAELEAQQVVLLLSRVHTPTDNPAVEHRNGELKAESGLASDVVLSGPEEAEALLAPAIERLDRHRLRASRGYKTAEELDQELPRADEKVLRARFYAEACSAIKDAVRGLTDATAIRKAEQDAIWSTLEKHGLARRHVGRRRLPRPSPGPATPGENG